MTPTRLRTLLLIAALCAAFDWLLLRLIYTSLPPLPWTGVPALLLLAAVEAASGWNIRSRLRGRNAGLKPVAPIAVARMAALAKASSLAASVVGGLALGFLIYVAASLDKQAYQADAYVSGATFASAVILAGAALYLEYNCRVPPSEEDRDESPDGSGQAHRR